jgi:hypothetical protein
MINHRALRSFTMMSSLQAAALRASRTWWLYLLLFGVTIFCLRALTQIGDVFPAVAGGSLPFDLQNGLTAEQVYPQLSGYTDEARSLYRRFTLIDYVFPCAAGLFVAATAAFALRHSYPRWYEWLTTRQLLPLFMLASAFDWLENLAIASAMWLYPAEYGALPQLVILAKRCKLAFIFVSQGITVVLLLVALTRWAIRRFRGAS